MTTSFPRLVPYGSVSAPRTKRRYVDKQEEHRLRWAPPFPRTQQRPERSALVYQAEEALVNLRCPSGTRPVTRQPKPDAEAESAKKSNDGNVEFVFGSTPYTESP